MHDELVSRTIQQLSHFIEQRDALEARGLMVWIFELIREDVTKLKELLAEDNPRSGMLAMRRDVVAFEIAAQVEELSMMIVEPGSGSLLKKVRSFIPCCSSGNFSPLAQDLSVYIYINALRFNRLMNTSPEVDVEPELKPQDENDESYCRENDKKRLLEHLLGGSAEQVEVIAIVGFLGSGKTTLARSLYDDDSVKQHFHDRDWTDVLGETNIFIPKHIFGKKVLFVLDGVEKTESVSNFKERISDSCPGSKILMTTRSQEVADGSDFVYKLDPLSNSDCRSLILQGLAQNRRREISPEMNRIAKKIARSCKGSPQTAKIVGMELRDKHTAEEWQQVLDTGIGEMEEEVTSRFSKFYKTYNELSLKSKLCLWYCASFPRDHVINVDQLIRLWMAEGYLDCHTGQADDKELQRMGIECFDELTKQRIFLNLEKDSIHKDETTSCKIQAVAHEFIKSIVFYCSVEKFRSSVSFSGSKVPKYLFWRMERLRALVLSSCDLEQLPAFVLGLSLLQYLDLSRNPLKELPEKIDKLSSLQSLDVSSCYELSDLPGKIGEVKTLQHLRVNDTTDELHDLPQGFENMTLLRTLDVVRVGGRYDSNVKKLEGLNHLEDIRIAVHGKVNFPDAYLERKAEMKNLELCFVEYGLDPDIAQCIDKLKPPPELEMLKIDYYPGLRLPKWILDGSIISKLRRLSVRSGSNISSLPGLWKLACLEFLWLYDIPRMKRLGLGFVGLKEKKSRDDHGESSDDSEDDEEISDGKPAFPCLKTLRIEHLWYWKTWEDIDEADADAKRIKVMPILKELIINDCPVMEAKALPRLVLGKISSLEITINNKLVHLESDHSSGGKATDEIEPVQC